jgi:hypothetical protein
MQAMVPAASLAPAAKPAAVSMDQIQQLFWNQMQQGMSGFAAMTGALCAPPRKTG